MQSATVLVTAAVLGLAIGSFLNVVIYRVPAGKSIASPRSCCPSCGELIRARDNIPILSWVALGGRCRSCRAPISWRYPLVEVLTAVLFVLVAARIGARAWLPAELAFVAGLIALAAIDVERYLLPRVVVYPTAALVGVALLAAAAAGDQWRRLGIAAACAAAAFGVFFAINFLRPAWMGFGDVRLSGLMGLALGWLGPWYVVIGFLAANLAGALVGAGLLLAKRATRQTPLPYGLFLAAGSASAILFGGPIIHWYSSRLVG